jgi:simple sugar transport system ATP-binding protein
MASQQALLETRGIAKSFPGVRALVNVDFALYPGEIHTVMGENGAGKSTLIKVLTGVETPDSGQMWFDGAPFHPRSPHHAQQLGISTVYQEVNLCPNLSVAENIFIGREPRRWGRIDWHTIEAQAHQELDDLGLGVDVRQPLGSYSVAIQQMVAIARARAISAKALILDEPTSSLDAGETIKLFAVMRLLREKGLGIIFITHFLDQVYAVSDRITVLRQGELVGTYEAATLPQFELISKMIGRELETRERLQEQKQEDSARVYSPTVLRVKGLGKRGMIAPIDLELRAGRVLGLAGLLGSGRTETTKLIFGIEQADSGSVQLQGRELKPLSPSKSLHAGIGMCPEDRRADGIIPDLTVRENIILAVQAQRGWLRPLPAKAQAALVQRYISALNIRTPDAERPVKTLSGGNQQKVILARWLATNPQVLLLDEPTRGIDIGAKTEIQKLVLNLAAEGKAVLFISSELDEVARCSHEVVVLRDRQKVAELRDAAIDVTTIMQTIAEKVRDDYTHA